MSDQNATIVQDFDASPEQVIAAVTDVRGWWPKTVAGGPIATG